MKFCHNLPHFLDLLVHSDTLLFDRPLSLGNVLGSMRSFTNCTAAATGFTCPEKRYVSNEINILRRLQGKKGQKIPSKNVFLRFSWVLLEVFEEK